jgi:hypothetical protein
MSIPLCENKTLHPGGFLELHHHISKPQQRLGHIVFSLWILRGYRNTAWTRGLGGFHIRAARSDEFAGRIHHAVTLYASSMLLLYSGVSNIRETSRCHTHRCSFSVDEVASINSLDACHVSCFAAASSLRKMFLSKGFKPPTP